MYIRTRKGNLIVGVIGWNQQNTVDIRRAFGTDSLRYVMRRH